MYSIIKESFQENGKGSGKAVMAFIAMLLIVFIVVRDTVENTVSDYGTLSILTGFIFTLYSLKTAATYLDNKANSNGTTSKP